MLKFTKLQLKLTQGVANYNYTNVPNFIWSHFSNGYISTEILNNNK